MKMDPSRSKPKLSQLLDVRTKVHGDPWNGSMEPEQLMGKPGTLFTDSVRDIPYYEESLRHPRVLRAPVFPIDAMLADMDGGTTNKGDEGHAIDLTENVREGILCRLGP